ncbi:MAG TPA: class I SAM-dependent methyltransferase [Candidatus Acidoferrales bacterium]|nr:class I SAM-dependent methyltransferase [Candidatus Acidoferrales bacterium]
MPSRPYSLLARYYDELTRGAPRMNRIAREKILGRILSRARTVCDLGCGTGTAAVELARRGHTVYALDFSPDMVRLARRKVRRLPPGVRSRLTVRRADMRSFRLSRPADLVLSQFNPINHLPRKSDLVPTFHTVARALRPGGWFLFDINTRRTYEQIYSMTRWEEKPGFCLVYRGRFDPRRDKARLDLEWFIRNGATWRRYRERIEDTCWSDAEIRRALRRAGFRRIRFWDGADVRPPSAYQKRGLDGYYLAQKPIQGGTR